MRKSILVICGTNLQKAPRFLTQLEALYKDYDIIAAGYSGDLQSKKYKFIPLIKGKREANFVFHLKYPFIVRKAISATLRIIFFKTIDPEKNRILDNFNLLKKYNYDLVISHHLNDLPMGVKLAQFKGVKLIFNAHEYYPLQFEDKPEWMKNTYPYNMKIARDNFKFVDACFCVGTKIAEKYKQEFNLDSLVITNAKPFVKLQPKPIDENDKIKLIHHGAANRSRKIEFMIELVKYLGDKYTLDLVLVPGEEKYIDELKHKAAPYSNINFPEAVSTQEISTYINKYDIGVYILPPTNFNGTNALPNKFFEFVQARLAIAIGPSPEMAYLLNKYDLGVVSDDFTTESLAEKILQLDADKIMYYKNQAHKHAQELSVDENMRKINETVSNLLKG